MRVRSAGIVAVLAAVVVGGAGCPSSCPLESPQVDPSALPASCTAAAGQPVTYPVRLCPTCNQTSASCDVNLSGVGAGSGPIYLDTKVEACSGSASCPASCQTNPIGCTFNAPAMPGTYTVIVYDGTSGNTQQSQLTVTAGGAASCGFTAGI